MMKKVFGIALICSGITLTALLRWRKAKKECTRLEKEMHRLEILARNERAGRCKAQKSLREQVHAQELGKSGLGLGRPIGIVHTPFKEKNGCPRQGNVVPAAKGVLQIRLDLNPMASLDGLDAFSHIIILWLFHENTDYTRQVKQTYRAKVAPPRLDGKKVGVFSTRTPHRPNPIGLSVVKIDWVDAAKGEIHISGIDLLDGTPVIDFKPYVPAYDSVAGAHAAPWVDKPPVEPFESVVFSDSAMAQINLLAVGEDEAADHKVPFEFYSNAEDVCDLILQSLIQDPRSVHRRAKGFNPSSDGLYQLCLDALVIKYEVIGRTAVVRQIVLRNSEEGESIMYHCKAGTGYGKGVEEVV